MMQEVLMDVLRALAAPNLDIRRKTLDIALDLITARNIDEVRCAALGRGDVGPVEVGNAAHEPRLGGGKLNP